MMGFLGVEKESFKRNVAHWWILHSCIAAIVVILGWGGNANLLVGSSPEAWPIVNLCKCYGVSFTSGHVFGYSYLGVGI